jgi:RNA-directed DNA polymerase
MYWKRWERTLTRYENLIQLGISPEQAWQRANTRKGYWRIAGSPILKHTLANQYLETLGFPEVLKQFEMPHERIGRCLRIRMPVPAHRTAVYGPVCTVV